MKPKKKCPVCKRMLNTRCFVFNKIKKTKICRQCDKRIGHNKFYVPQVKNHQHEVPTKYSITTFEAQRIWEQLIRQGMTGEQANKRIWSLRFQLRMNKLSKYKLLKQMKQSSLNQKFLEGLKNEKIIT